MDEVDLTGQRQEAVDELLAKERQAAAEMEAGFSGDCYQCGEESERLMGAAYFLKHRYSGVFSMLAQADAENYPDATAPDNGICARCRTKNKYP